MLAVYESRPLAHKPRKFHPKRRRSGSAQPAAAHRLDLAPSSALLTDRIAVAGSFERVDVLVNNAGDGFFAPQLRWKSRGFVW
jgi:NAD(P)-dependent dehydrogenase (short-subunit alcohol dehydrogenase family)